MGGKELKTIHVSEEVWRRLVELKLELKLRSMDEVVRWLLARAHACERGGGEYALRV
jgi:predicted CopG family antitoxin